MKRVASLFSLFLLFNQFISGQISFSEQSNQLGCISSSYGMGTLGGGISFFDFDNDGWDDITVSSESGQPVRFYKNNSGVFSAYNLNINDELFETKTVQWVDFDNDGDYDFFATSNAESNRLYENDGAMNFTNITTQAGLDLINHKTFGASWGDYNNDGWLDVFLSSRNLVDSTMPNILFRNNGDGTFTNVNNIVGISTINHYSFCSAFFDFNNDGWQDIYIANDKYDSANIFYKNNGDGTFTEVGTTTGTNISIDAMSTTIGDYDNDGWLDIYVTNTIDGNILLKNNGDETFSNVATSTGTIMESVAFGAVFLDADNDADIDLYVSGPLNDDASTLPAAFFENDGSNNFTIPLNSGFENDTATSFSNAIGDINNDGYPDISVLNFAPNDIYLWENNCFQTNNWIKIKLQGVQSNRQGIGSWIEISVNGNKQYNYTLCGEGYLGQNSSYEFFGIGTADSIDYIKVTWLSGIVDTIIDPNINVHGTIIEGSNSLTLSTNIYNQIKNEITIFPNPSKNYIAINLNKSMVGSSLKINDVYGKKVFQKDNLNQSNKLDLSKLSNGVYFINIIKDNINETIKIVIN